MTDRVRRAAEIAARDSYSRLLAYLAARTRDIAGAEDALAEAFASALSAWPRDGVPDNPDAWLLTVARRRQADEWRRAATRRQGEAHLHLIGEELSEIAMQSQSIPDRRLALMFACAHPEIEPDMRCALILQTIMGLTAADIGAAFLVPAGTMGQRLVRAKARITQRGIALEIPEGPALPARLAAVLEALYAAYTKGWLDIDQGGGALAEEAIWLCRLVVAQVPEAPEAKGMLALMLYSHARRNARRSPDGTYLPFDQQDTGLWDRAALDEAEHLLLAASSTGETGRCQIEAAIQSAHITRRLAGVDNWPSVLRLYDILLAMTGSAVVRLNRAAAVAAIEGPRAALASLDALATDKRMQDYQPYWALYGQLLGQAGNNAAAYDALTIAIGLSTDASVRRWLDSRRKALLDG